MATKTKKLSLHKEGIFYKLYNQHAMLFTSNVKSLKINIKFVKFVGHQVYSCGFPATSIEDVKKQLRRIGGRIDESEKRMTVTGINWRKKGNYSKWCREQELKAAPFKNECRLALTNIEKQVVAFQVMRTLSPWKQ